MGKFELTTLDKAQVVSMVNALGAEVSEAENKSVPEKIYAKAGALLNGLIFGNDEKSLALKAEISQLGLDSPEGRKEFLNKRLGIDARTTDDYRLAVYTNDAGQVTLFKGHMDGDKKLVLTDSLPFPDRPDKLHQLFQSDFKPLPKAIEVPVEKSIVTPEGTRLDVLPEEQKKLENQSALAAAVLKSGDVPPTNQLNGVQKASGAWATMDKTMPAAVASASASLQPNAGLTEADKKQLAAILAGHDYSNRFVRAYYLMPEHEGKPLNKIELPRLAATDTNAPSAEPPITGGQDVSGHEGVPKTPAMPKGQSEKAPEK